MAESVSEDRRARERGSFIPASECVGLLKRIIFSNASIRLENRRLTWRAVYNGDVPLIVDDYALIIFNDCGKLDYVDSITSYDGKRAGDFAQWDTNPVDLLTVTERALLTGVLEIIDK